MYTQWIENCVVQRVSVRDGLVLDLDDYNEIVISCPLLLTLPAVDRYPVEAVRIDPLKIATDERPLLNLAGAVCTQAWSGDDGGLHLRFSRGHSIDVDPDSEETAWELYGKRHGYMDAYPGGGYAWFATTSPTATTPTSSTTPHNCRRGRRDRRTKCDRGRGRVNFGGNAWIRLNVDRTALATSRRASIPE